MDYYITEEQFGSIQQLMPDGLVFAYHDSRDRHVHNPAVLEYWNIDINYIINGLYSITYDEFLIDRFEEMQQDPIYVSEVIQLIYVPIGTEVIQRFMGRNGVDGINLAQSEHVIQRTSMILNFLSTGSIPNALQSLAVLAPDNMTNPDDWITQERIDVVIADIISLLPAPPTPPEPEPSPI